MNNILRRWSLWLNTQFTGMDGGFHGAGDWGTHSSLLRRFPWLKPVQKDHNVIMFGRKARVKACLTVFQTSFLEFASKIKLKYNDVPLHSCLLCDTKATVVTLKTCIRAKHHHPSVKWMKKSNKLSIYDFACTAYRNDKALKYVCSKNHLDELAQCHNKR